MVAHRGDSSRYPENTVPAIEGAVRAGADLVEVDVRLTADGIPVVLHDPKVDRTTDGSGWVHELTAAAVALLEAGRVAGEPAGIPSLSEALDVLSGRTGVIIEIKNLPAEPGFVADAEPHVEAVLAEISGRRFEGPVMVSSFNPRSIERCKELEPAIATGLLSTADVDAAAALVLARERGHDAALPNVKALLAAGRPLVDEAHQAGIMVGTWTVDDEPTIELLFGWGVDAVATNRPAAAVRVRDRIAGG